MINIFGLKIMVKSGLEFFVFKLADRMRSMRTNGASRNRDWCYRNGGDFPQTEVPIVCISTFGMYMYLRL